MERLREMSTWNIRPAVEIHKIRRYGWEIAGFVVLVIGLVAIMIGGLLI